MLPIYFIFCGIISILLQVFLLREIAPVFHGNEFTIAIVLANWLFASAFANFTAHKKLQIQTGNIVILFLCLIISVIFSFVFIRSANLISPTSITDGFSLKFSLILSLIAIFPVSFFINLIFSLFVTNSKFSILNIFYNIGIIAGGIICSFYMSSFLTAVIIAIIISLIFCDLIILCDGIFLKILMFISLCLIIYTSFNYIDKFEKKTIHNNYKTAESVDISYFANQQYIWTKTKGEDAFYNNGVLNFAFPSPTIFEDEDFAHLAILHHTNPENLLLIGGIRYLSSIVKYKFNEIDYLEPDKVIIEKLKQNIYAINEVFNDERIHTYSLNIRDFFKVNNKQYDVILIGLDLPINTNINRFYTKDFFEISKQHLSDNGFIALKLPGNLVYWDELMSKLNSSVYYTLKNVFENVQIIPGTQNILVATKYKIPYRLHLKKRLQHVQGSTFVLSKYYVDERMDTQKTKWLKFQLEKVSKKKLINTDKIQKTMIYSIMYWQSKFSPFLAKFLQTVINYSYIFFLIPVILFFLPRHTHKITSFIAGASDVWVQMVCFWAFQIYAGHIYKWFGILIAIFALGNILGIISCRFNKPKVNKLFAQSEIAYLLWIILCVVAIKTDFLNWFNILIFLFGTGILSGWQFEEILKIYSHVRDTASQMKIYASNSLGGAFAAILGGAFLIPVWGIEKSLMFILFLKFLTFAWWKYYRGMDV